MNKKYLLKKVFTHGLRVASRRQFTLFGGSCVAIAYTKILREHLGFSYQAVAVSGSGKRLAFIFNEPRIIRRVRQALIKNKRFADSAIRKAESLHNKKGSLLRVAIKLAKKDPRRCLDLIIKYYPLYLAGLGIYNCFWRFVGNDGNNLFKTYITKVARERDNAAKLYPFVEQAIIIASANFGKSIFGRAVKNLQFLTLEEMKQFLHTNIVPVSSEELRARNVRYFFFLTEKRGWEVVTGNDAAYIFNAINDFGKKVVEVSGHSAYPGVVHGKVYNLERRKKDPVGRNFVLVVSATHPNEIDLVRKSAAIVANEGGILSHAAIVARELKKPCVIGTKIATEVFHTGDRVEVDAIIGVVKKIK